MRHRITVLPGKQNIEAATGENLLQALRKAGLSPDAPCGGDGRCGKCTVLLEGKKVLACQTAVHHDMTVTLPTASHDQILTQGASWQGSCSPIREGKLLAFDIGTTTVAGFLLDGATGQELAVQSTPNPQAVFGADVISRIRHALNGHREELTQSIRRCISEMAHALCQAAGVSPAEISVVSVVGNPAMQQLFLGLEVENLARIPFAPVLTEASAIPAGECLPLCPKALLLIVPDISGFVGADTVGGILATDLDRQDPITLLVDIGTNGEMVLGNRHRMVSCSAAAGPALEGANIRFGMRGQAGAVDHVWVENGQLRYSVIGDGKAVGICGSGLIDAVAAALDLGLLNQRGKILTEDHLIHLADGIYLTQEDIRQVQLAKGAIAAGIQLMAAHLGLTLEDVAQVYLAGAFGTFMDPRSACRIGLLPAQLQGRIQAVGNAAGSGAKMLACQAGQLERAQQLVTQTEFIELAAAPGFQRCFAESMRF